MRVHLGSDHAGFELKQAVLRRVAELGHEPVDHGPPTYDAQDDYPPYVLRAAAATAAEPDSLGVVHERAVVDGLVPLLLEPTAQVVLQLEAGMVGSEVHTHASSLPEGSVARVRGAR